MLVVPTEIRPSKIHGTGVFLTVPVKKGDLIWRFDSRIDRVYGQNEMDEMPESMRMFVDTYGCAHHETGLWMVPGDNGRYLNHSENPACVSNGPFGDDIAARNLAAGEELTVDYKNICDVTRTTGRL